MEDDGEAYILQGLLPELREVPEGKDSRTSWNASVLALLHIVQAVKRGGVE